MPATGRGLLGTGSSKAAATTLAVTNTTGAIIPAGTLVHVVGAWDNINSVTAPTITSSTIGGAAATANHATAIGSGITTTAGAGTWHQCFRALTTADIASGATICTLTSNQSAVVRAAHAEGWNGATATLRGTVATGTSTSGAPSVATAGTALVAKDLVIGSVSNENNAQMTGDADTLNGSWSAIIGTRTTGGNAQTNQNTGSQFKVVTATGVQTYNPTSGVADSIACVYSLVPVPDPAITQAAYRWYEEGTESGAVPYEPQDTPVVGNLGNGDATGTLRIRLQSTTAVAVPATDDFQLQYEKNASGTWVNVTAVSTAAATYDSPNLTNGAATTNRLTGGTGTFVAGKVSEDSLMDDLGWAGTNHTELVYALKIKAADLVDGESLRFRILRNNTTTEMTYAQTPVIYLVKPPPLVTQAAYRFYADGTETGATALAAQDTAPTVDLASGDVNLGLRMRLQETNDGAVPATTDWQLQWEKNTSGTWANMSLALPTLADAYPSSNFTGGATPLNSTTWRGQSFLGDGRRLASARFYVAKSSIGGPPVGTVTAALYAHTGTYGSGTATGSALAVSTTTIDATTLPPGASITWASFDFDSSFVLTNGVPYVIAVTATLSSGEAEVGTDNSTPTHSGAQANYASSAWSALTTSDLIFEVYTSAPGTTVAPYDSPNLTNGAATTNRLGAGSGSFIAGEVSETGIASNLGWLGSNFTEVLYALTLKAADLANADTLRFRVLKDGVTTGLTYTQVPTLTVAKGAVTQQATVALTGTSTLTATGTVSAPPAAPSITQYGYKFYADGTQSGSDELASQNSAPTADVGVFNLNLGLRFRLQSTTAVAVPATDDFQLQYEKNASGTWVDVDAASPVVSAYDSPDLADEAATTNRLTGSLGGTFVAGKISEDGLVDNLGWTGNNYTDLLYSITIKRADVADADTLRFRVLRNGSADLTYTQTATLNVNFPAPISAIPSNFTDPEWFHVAEVTASPTRLTIAATSPVKGSITLSAYDLVGGRVFCEFAQLPTGTGGLSFDIRTPGDRNIASLYTAGSTLWLEEGPSYTTVASTAWDPAQPFVSFRESGGTFYVERSATGQPGTWSLVGSFPTPSTVGTVKVFLYAFNSTSEGWIEDLNTPASVTQQATVSLTATSTLTATATVETPAGRTPPTLVSSTKTTSWTSTTTPRSTPSVSWLAGDTILVIGGVGDETSTLATPTATGLTFANIALTNNPTGDFCDAWVWTATAAANGSSTINGSRTSGGSGWGLAVLVIRGSEGTAAEAVGTSTTKTLSLVRTQDESAVVWCGFDWSASAAAATFTPTVDTSIHNATEGSSYSVHIGYWSDEDAAGTTAYGVTSTSNGSYAKIAVEILGAGAGEPEEQFATVALSATSTLTAMPTGVDLIAAMQFPVYIAHRGGAEEGPENTMVAFNRAAAVDDSVAFETDVQRNQDTTLVLMHDTTVDRTAGNLETGSVSTYTDAEWDLLTVDDPTSATDAPASYWAELYSSYPDRVIFPEATHSGVASDFIAALAANPDLANHVIMQAFNRTTTTNLANAGFYTLQVYSGALDLADDAARGMWGIAYPAGHAEQGSSMVTTAHGLGLKVLVYTTDSTGSRDTHLGFGVDGLMTDLPGAVGIYGPTTVSASVALSAASTLSTTGVPERPATVALTATSTLTATAVRQPQAAVSLTAASTLTVAATTTPAVFATVGLSATSTLTTTAVRAPQATVPLVAASTLTATATRFGVPLAVVPLTSVATLTATAIRVPQATVSLTAASTLTATATTVGMVTAAVGLSATSTLTTAGAISRPPSVTTIPTDFSNNTYWGETFEGIRTPTQIETPATWNQPSVYTLHEYDLVGARVFIKVTQLPTDGPAGAIAFFTLYTAVNVDFNERHVAFAVQDDVLDAAYFGDAGWAYTTSVAWDPGKPFLAFREASGTMYWERSATGQPGTWEVVESTTDIHMAVGALSCEAFSVAASGYGSARFESLNTPETPTVTATVALTASSTLTATSVRVPQAAASLTAASTLTATAVRIVPATASLTAASTLTATAVRQPQASVSLVASSTLTATGVRTVLPTTALSAVSTLTATAERVRPAATTLAATSTLTAAAVREPQASVSLVAASTLTATALRTVPSSVSLVAGSTLTATGFEEAVGAVPLSATSTLTATATVRGAIFAAAALAATSTLTATSIRVPQAAASLTAASTLTATALRTAELAAALTATSTLVPTAVGITVVTATVPLTATSTLTTAAVREPQAAASLVAASTLTSSMVRVVPATASLTAASTLTATSVREPQAAASLVSASSLTATAVRTVFAATSLTATSTLTATVTTLGAVFASADLTASSTLTATAVRVPQASVSLVSSSTLTTTAIRVVPATAALTASSILTATSVREPQAAASLAAASTLTATAFRIQQTVVALSATSTLTPVAIGVTFVAGAVALTASSTLTAGGVRTVPATVPLAAVSTLTATAVRQPQAAVSLVAASTLTTTVLRTVQPTVALSATSTLAVTAVGVGVTQATVALTATSTLTATALRTARVGAVPLTAGSTLTAGAVRTRPATSSLTAASTLTTTAVRQPQAAASLTAASTLTVVAVKQLQAMATLSAGATLTALGVPIQPGAGVPDVTGTGSLHARDIDGTWYPVQAIP